MLKKNLTTVILITSIGITLPAAAFGRVLYDDAEADRVKVIFNNSGHVERIRVEGCKECPFELHSSNETRFTYKGKQIKEKDTKTHSGKSGTVFFDPESSYAIKVNW